MSRPSDGGVGLVPAVGYVAMQGPSATVLASFVAEAEGELTADEGDCVRLLLSDSVPEGWVVRT